ncbi:hypothetical protein ACH5RR_035573 [Cinchona calisaya]|uniref:RING-type domain-containing protein n=1 Tax=Cinchona calisaya TaxID=153742 RepID=A0ABD2Y5N6_9GENT
MGLSNFPSPAEGVLPVLVINTLVSMTILKNMVRSLLGASSSNNSEVEDSSNERFEGSRARRVSITRYRSLCENRCNNNNIGRSSSGINNIDGGGNMWTLMECCVCLCRFEADEEVIELSCKHFFHKGCLQKWFDNQHSTCPLCRSIM